MKGIVFTEFLELVETAFSPEIADEIINKSALPSKGAYTAVGTYDGAEMVRLLNALSQATNTPIETLLTTFGRYLFDRFVALYPVFFENCHSSFEFLPRVGEYIHVEVRKLYPDAELPQITTQQRDTDTLDVFYESPRCMGKLARGLIEGCIAHFRENLSIMESQPPGSKGDRVQFTLKRQVA